MNIIQKQADEFHDRHFHETVHYKKFIEKLRSELLEYNNDSHKLEFINRIISNLRRDYDKHFEVCEYKNDRMQCGRNNNFENSLFFINNEKEELLSYLDESFFNEMEKEKVNESLEKILLDLNQLKVGQEFTYNDVYSQFEEMRDLIYLNKKPWTQLFVGKLSEMVTGGIISEAVSKQIIEIVRQNYNGLLY